MQRGFTLIELMISTAVILMVLAITLPAFMAFQHKQNLLSSAQSIRDGILEAQNYALAPQDTKTAGADYYRIIFVPGDGGAIEPTYEIDEQTNTDKVTPTWKKLKTGILPYGISYCSFSHSTMISATANPIDDPTNGIIYSVSELGKAVKPVSSGRIWLKVRQKSLSSLEEIALQVETSRVDVQYIDDPAPGSCL